MNVKNDLFIYWVFHVSPRYCLCDCGVRLIVSYNNRWDYNIVISNHLFLGGSVDNEKEEEDKRGGVSKVREFGPWLVWSSILLWVTGT